MNGFININKASGVSSAREVGIIKRISGTPCGHMGTLDPMASGVLPIAIGNAARLFDYFLSKRKKYVATFRFGVDYDTLDTTGNLISEGKRVPSREEILAVLPSLTGEIDQIPPRYSAKCVNGKRGYMLARSGEDFTLPPKRVSIYGIDLLSSDGVSEYVFGIECGGGTYVRSVARDMAERLGTVAAMSALVRTASGPFTIENSVTTQELNADNLAAYIIPTESLLPFDSFTASGKVQKRLLNGLSAECALGDGTYKLFCQDGSFYGLAEVTDGAIKVRTKLC